MKRILAIIALVLFPLMAAAQVPGSGFGVQNAWDNPMQNIGDDQSKPGFQKVNWEPGIIIPLRLRDGMLTIINFPEWETIRDAYVGDKDFFDGRPVERNTFMITPVDGRAMADTNLFIFGQSGNKYVFYLRSEPFTTERITSSIVEVNVPIRFRRGPGGAGAASNGGGLGGMTSLMGGGQRMRDTGDQDWENEDFGWIKSIPVDPTDFRFDLDVFVPNPDDYVIAPERVWRDQVFTYIDFGERALAMNQRPVVSLLVENGESPVGFRTEGPQSRLLVVEAVGDLVLRNGGRLVCIKLRSKPYLLSNPPPPMDLVAVAGDIGPGRAGIPAGYSPTTGAYVGGGGGAGMGYSAAGMPSVPNFAAYGAAGFPAGATPMAGTQAAGPRVGMIPGAPQTNASILPTHHVPLVRQNERRTSLELFKGRSVTELENQWLELTEHNPWLDEYVPFYSVETSGVDELGAQMYFGGEIYRLRIGPFDRIEEANSICSRLAQKRVPCSIVRAQ